MGLFDIFKKKKTDSTFPENELEQSLMDAPTKVSAQKEFYQKLLWNELYVLTVENPGLKEGSQKLEENVTVKFVTFENGAIPIFTATNRIFDKGIIKEEVPFVSLKGQDLFEIAKGFTFILNPNSDHAKELVPEEIEALMNGTIFDKIDEDEIENKKYEEFNELFQQAGARQEPLILMDGYKNKALKESDKFRLLESISDFKKCLEMIPDHWQSMMLMAKAYQRLGEHTEALELLETAFKIELENHSIPMEASLEAMHLKRLDKALFYSEESLNRNPNDFALLGNHAMNLLIAKKDKEAFETIEKAIKLQPKDQVNQNIKMIVTAVMAGNRKRPTFEDTIR